VAAALSLIIFTELNLKAVIIMLFSCPEFLIQFSVLFSNLPQYQGFVGTKVLSGWAIIAKLKKKSAPKKILPEWFSFCR